MHNIYFFCMKYLIYSSVILINLITLVIFYFLISQETYNRVDKNLIYYKSNIDSSLEIAQQSNNDILERMNMLSKQFSIDKLSAEKEEIKAKEDLLLSKEKQLEAELVLLLEKEKRLLSGAWGGSRMGAFWSLNLQNSGGGGGQAVLDRYSTTGFVSVP